MEKVTEPDDIPVFLGVTTPLNDAMEIRNSKNPIGRNHQRTASFKRAGGGAVYLIPTE